MVNGEIFFEEADTVQTEESILNIIKSFSYSITTIYPFS